MSALLAAVLVAATLAGILVTGAAAVGRDNGLGSRPALPQGILASGLPAAAATGTIRVAVVLGSSGTEAADVLAPYDVFARSPRFTVTTVAADRSPVQLVGAPAVVPSTTFADIDAGLAPAPDVLVVPAVEDPNGNSEAATRSWILRQSGHGIRVLGVCAGSMLLAQAGVLDGHRATSHWSRLDSLRKSRPAVQWVSGQRFVQDGLIITTAGVTSGVPGALHLMQELVGDSEAARVGAEVGYPGWSTSTGTEIPGRSFGFEDATVALNAALPWFRPTVGIGLTDGISELDVAATFDVYTVSGAARTVALAAGGSITTKHGLVLLTNPLPGTGHGLDRMILPGSAAYDARLASWAENLSIDTTLLSPPLLPRNPFDAVLEDLSLHAGTPTALTTAKFIDYPTAQLHLSAAGSDTRSTWLLILAGALAVFAGFLPSLLRRIPVLAHRKTSRRNTSTRPIQTGRKDLS
ncbi:MAG: DJ/PfpI family protein [Micrococcaceae bacterium]|nr:DJ/PfpI family protein [Micrococcaceae bacterium]